MQDGFAGVDNGRLYFEAAGSGAAVVFIHGNTGDRRHWEAQFEAFAGHFRTLRYDARGFGRSSLPLEGHPYSHHDDLAALLDHLAIESAHLVGWSMGAGIAVDFVLAHPGRARSVVAVGPWVSGYSCPAAGEMIDDMRQVRTAMASNGHDAAVAAWMNAPFFRETIRDPAAGQRFEEVARDYTFWHFAHKDPHRGLHPSAAGRLDAIRVPALALVGEHDIPACREMADLLCGSVAGCQKALIPNAGHLMHIEQPGDFNEVVMRFLRGIGAR